MGNKQIKGQKRTFNKRLLIPVAMAVFVSYELLAYSNSFSVGISALMVLLVMTYITYNYGVRSGKQYIEESKKQQKNKSGK